MLVDIRKGSMIPPDLTVKLHAGSRIPLDPVAKGIAGSMIPPDLMRKTWADLRIPKDFTIKDKEHDKKHGRVNDLTGFCDISAVANTSAAFWSIYIHYQTMLLNGFPSQG